MRHAAILLVGLVILMAAANTIRAADGTWTTDVRVGTWGDSNNWLDGIIADGEDSTAYFTVDLTGCDCRVEMYTDRTIGRLQLSDGGGDGSGWYLGQSGVQKTLTLSTTTGTPTITNATNTMIRCKLAGNQGFIYNGSDALALINDMSNLTGDIVANGNNLQIMMDAAFNPATNLIADNNVIIYCDVEIGGFSGGGYVYLCYGCDLTVGAGDQSTTFSGTLMELDSLSSLVKAGNGTFTLGGNTSNKQWSGGTTFQGGVLSVSDATYLGDGVGTAGALTFDGGALQVTGTTFGEWTKGYVWADGGGGFDIDDASHTFTVNDALTGGGGLTKTGAGTLVLTAANTFGGTTKIEGGTLRIEHAEALSGTTLEVPATGLDIAVTNPIFGGLSGSGDLSACGWVSAGGNNEDTTYSGSISACTGFTKNGNGTLILEGDNSGFDHTLAINAGTVALAGSDTIGETTKAVVWGTLRIDGAIQNIGVLEGNGQVNLNGPNQLIVGNGDATWTYNGSVVGAGRLTKAGSGTLTLTGDIACEDGLSITGGTVYLSGSNERLLDTAVVDTGAGTTLHIGLIEETLGGIRGLGVVQNDGLLIVDCANDHDFEGTFSGTGNLTKRGTGTYTLHGDSSGYGGMVTIEEGVLEVLNAHALGTGNVKLDGGTLLVDDGITVDVQLTACGSNGGTFAGNGTFDSNMVTGAGVTVSPGTSAGELTFDGFFLHKAGGVLAMELGGTAAGEFDVLNVTGQLDVQGGILAVTLIDGFVPAEDDVFDVLNWDSITGTSKFDTIDLPDLSAWGLAWDDSSLYSTGELAVVVPEPATLGMLTLGGLGVLLRSRRR